MILLMLSISANKVHAQVDDISLTFSPAAEYIWWDNAAGLEDNFLYGGDIGFGFGQFLELKATYKQATDLKRDFSQFGLPIGYENLLNPNARIDLTRWGGELKTNFGTNKFSPFVILGTGVQTIKTSFNTETESIFASAGLGFKINLSDRIVFNIEGRNTFYNFNAINSLMNLDEITSLGLVQESSGSDKLYNWSALASIQFYLGGRQPNELSELDKAYIKKLKGGFSGFKFVFEPAANYIAFDNNSNFRDTWLAGAYLGFEFNEYIGLHGFYFQATENEELFSSFDDLAIYGLELRAKLNDGNGVTPYAILGGGYLNAYENIYQTTNSLAATSSEFAKGGLGLEIPVSKYFSINASASGMLTANEDIEDVSSTRSLETHINYSLGLNFHFGKSSKSPDKIYADNVNSALSQKENELDEIYNEKFQKQQAENQEKLQKLKNSYTTEIDSLNTQLVEAKQTNNIDRAIKILELTKTAENNLDEVEQIEQQLQSQSRSTLTEAKQQNSGQQIKLKTNTQPKTDGLEREKTYYNMTPLEFEYLIKNILEDLNTTEKQQPTNTTVLKLQKQVDSLKAALNNQPKSKKLNTNDNSSQDEIKALNKRLNSIERQLNNNPETSSSETSIVNEINRVSENAADEAIVESKETYKRDFFNNFDYLKIVKETSKIWKHLRYKGSSVFTGINVGEQTSFDIGARAHYGFSKTKFELMPEFFVGLSDPTSFGLALNAIHPFRVKLPYNISPYFGAGGGYQYINNDSSFSGNILLGFYTSVFNGRLFVNYTNKNLFSNNQLSLGYRFNF